jgi:hypothetical protein
MRHITVFSILLTLVLIASRANALEPTNMTIDFNSQSLGWLEVTRGGIWNQMRVTINDQVSDGCWKSPQTSKTAAELELKRSKYGVSENTNDKLDNLVVLTALGYALNTQVCVVSLETSLVATVTENKSTRGDHELQNMRRSTIWDRKALISGPKSSMNSRIKETFINHIQSFLNSVDSIKKAIISKAYNTINVQFKEPRDLLPSKRSVYGKDLEELRQIWKGYFTGYAVKDR